MCESVVRPGGALSERRAVLESTCTCVAETRQPGSATVRVLCVGCLIAAHAAGTSHTKQVRKNREFRVTSNSLAGHTRVCHHIAHTYGHSDPPIIGFCNTRAPGRFAEACGVVSEFLYFDATHVLQNPGSLSQR